jgi:predicted ATPase/DNA-binding winged helix-turn-helix (wHTH) protein
MAGAERYTFGAYELDVGAHRLSRAGEAVALQPKPFEMLVHLVRARGELVPREELEARLWPDVVVTEHSLRQVALKLRSALGPDEGWVETVPRKGFRFSGPLLGERRDEVPSRLPAERDLFVGRADELAALETRFSAGARLISVVGPAGVGKTRLALRHARQRQHQAVWFCDLSEVRGLPGLVYAVARALDVALEPDARQPVAQLGHALAARGECLLVLDNFEHLVDLAEPTLGRWLDLAERCRLLVTTRRVLGVAGEEILWLAPLPRAEACALFVHRARAGRPELSDDELQPVGALVELLDGLPLAIELCAARVRLLPPARLLERLHDRFALLGQPHGRLPRQATLRAALDWSWELLQPAEQRALAQLSVFSGGFSLEAAEAVLDEPPALDRLQSLVDQSLCFPQGDRFGMLVSVQEYAADKLGAETEAAQVRHGAWFAALAGGSSPLQAELDNLVAATRRALERGDGATAGRCALAVWRELQQRGPFGAAAELLEAAAALPGVDRVALVLAAARARLSAGQRAQATAHLREGLALARERGDRLSCARALVSLGGLLEDGEVLEQALQMARELGAIEVEASALYNLGLWAEIRGDWSTAAERARRSRELHQAAGDPRAEARALSTLGRALEHLGQREPARQALEAALAVQTRAGDLRGESLTLSALGNLELDAGRLAEARAHLERALSMDRQMGDRQNEGIALGGLANLHLLMGQTEQALAYNEAAWAIARELGRPGGEAIAMERKAHVLHHERGQLDEAYALYDQARAIHRETGAREAEGYTLGQIGLIELDRGRPEQAWEALLVSRALPPVLSCAPLFQMGLAELSEDLVLAEEAAQRARPYPETAAVVLARRALLRARAGQRDEALADLAEASALAPSGLTRLEGLVAHVRLLTGSPEQAAVLREARELVEQLRLAPEAPLVRALRAASPGSRAG